MCSSVLINHIKHGIPRSHETGLQQRRITQSVSRVKGGFFSVRLATAPGSWSVSCLTSILHQKGKAVITNKLLLDNVVGPVCCIVMKRRQHNRTVTTKLRFCVSLGFGLISQRTTPSSQLFSSTHTFLMKYNCQHFVQ